MCSARPRGLRPLGRATKAPAFDGVSYPGVLDVEEALCSSLCQQNAERTLPGTGVARHERELTLLDMEGDPVEDSASWVDL